MTRPSSEPTAPIGKALHSRWRLQDAKARFSELLRLAHSDGPQHVTLHGRDAVVVIDAAEFQRLQGQRAGQLLPRLLLRVRPGTDEVGREAILAGWYRQLLKTELPALIAAWEPRLRVMVNGFCVQQMKTKWGGCNPTARTLRLNTELARKPKACLEYIVVHEMSHLLEPTHGPGFVALVDRFMPAWRETRTLLNRLPARYEDFNHPVHRVDTDPGKTHPEACVATPA